MNQRAYFLKVAAGWLLLGCVTTALHGQPAELRTGVAGHAFDHTGSITDQAETAAASGSTIIYSSGVGIFGYLGQPPAEKFLQTKQAAQTYVKSARSHGIRLVIDYICATSLVNLDTFDKNWTPEFRARFKTPPSAWRQQDRNGKPLPSWYGGQYNPACMNNPDWREYERFMVREQLESGADGIFFDNPTVHEQGCYCPWCMNQFEKFLEENGRLSPTDAAALSATYATAALRDWADKHPDDFKQFRCTIARDFIADMRTYARTIKPDALITANNSLNSPDVFFTQCRNFAYNIHEMSRTEDFVMIEDMSTQPRVLSNGQIMEYTPVYQLLHSICHGKPIVATVLADADYTTAPDLMRLAIAEAAANDASYLAWPTWPDAQRPRMAALVRPEMDLLRANAGLFQGARLRGDVVLFLPFRQWLATGQCRALQLSTALTRANVSFDVICEDELRDGALPKRLRGAKRLLAESLTFFTPGELKTLEEFQKSGGSILTAEKADWLASVQSAIGKPSVTVQGPATVRAIVRDQRGKTIVHLLNLDVQKVNSFEDKVAGVSGVRLTIRVPFKKARSVRALTADAGATAGGLKFDNIADGRESQVEVVLPRLDISTILVIE